MKRLVLAVFGGTLLLVGMALIVLPGPALLVIPAGLAVLATEFLWARRALRRCKGMVAHAKQRWRGMDCAAVRIVQENGGREARPS